MHYLKGYTNPSVLQKVSGVVLLLIVIIQVCAGYIINENGDLVPFRLYKKGGSRLHPRNCRGGFHKRLSADPVPEEISRDLYGLQVYTPKHKRTENTDKFDTSYRLDSSDIFDPGYDEQSMEDLSRPSKYKDRSDFKTAELDDALYGIFPSLKSEHFKNDLNLMGLSETDMETLNDMKEATLLLDGLSNGLEQVAEPPPLETESRVKAEIEEYPAYELMEDYDRRYRDNVDRHTEDISVYSPADTADIYAFRKRM